jgi:hypothetical protein
MKHALTIGFCSLTLVMWGIGGAHAQQLPIIDIEAYPPHATLGIPSYANMNACTVYTCGDSALGSVRNPEGRLRGSDAP